MLIPFGVFSAGVSGGDSGGGSFDLISTTLLTGSQASVTFSTTGLSAYKHLQLRVVTAVSSSADIQVQLNSDTASNYRGHVLYGDGTSVYSGNTFGGTTNKFDIGFVAVGNTFIPTVTDFLDFGSTTKNKTMRSFSGYIEGAARNVALNSAAWFSTAAITSIYIYPSGGTFNSGSRFSLYGIKG